MLKKIFFFVFGSLSFFLFFSSEGFAMCEDNGDISTTNFMVSVDCIDPVAADKVGNTSASGGKGAFLFVLQNFSELLLFMIPIIAAVSFLIAGYFYIFSAGDSEKTSKAKTIIKWNIIAMLVAFFSYGLVQIIVKLFSF